MKQLIRIERLSVKTKDGVNLVEPINLTLNSGRNLTILGETGSGKSLLAQAIMGALPSQLEIQGRVFVLSEEMDEQQRRTLWGKSLAMLPQEPSRSLDPTMIILKQTWESYYFVAHQTRQQSYQLAEQKLMDLSLSFAMQRYPHQLSGGMAQRAAFAIATGAGANIVIADEPTKGLDDRNKSAVIAMLKKVTEQGGSVLTITHDIDVAQKLGGDIMVMKKGQLLEYGEADQVLRFPRSEYARQLIAATPYYWNIGYKQEILQDKGSKLVSVRNLTLSRSNKVLFKDVTFDLIEGEVMGIFGESGIGKSSLGDVLCGLLKPTSGTIDWQKNLARQQVLKLYQDPPSAFAANISLATLLDDVIVRHRLDKAKIPLLLSQLKLEPELLKRSAEQVSGGELQRIAILRALLFEPKLLFADEVTSRLDPITQQETIELLLEQCRINKCALILVSHDKALLDKSCDKLLNLQTYTD